MLRFAPRLLHLRIAVDAELHHEVRHDAEEAAVVVVAVLHEVVEAIGALRRPGSGHLHDEHARRRREVDVVGGRRGFLERGRIPQRRAAPQAWRRRLGRRRLRRGRLRRRRAPASASPAWPSVSAAFCWLRRWTCPARTRRSREHHGRTERDNSSASSNELTFASFLHVRQFSDRDAPTATRYGRRSSLLASSSPTTTPLA